MPRRAKMKEEGEVHQDLTKVGSNELSEQQVKDYFAEAEAEMAAIDEIMRNAQQAAQPHVDQLKAIKKAAAENGMAKQVFSAKLRERSLRRKADRVREALNEQQQAEFDLRSQQLGDLFSFADRQDEDREAA